MTQIAQKTLRDILQEIEDAISKGRRDDAESKCQQILTQFPESLEAQRLLGEIYLAKGNLEEAQQAFDWVLTNDPENVIAYCDRALISEQQGDYDTALDCYQQAYELSRGNSKIRQQFNKLSQKAGQQGFMLSRAGLARLYMRGDLLTQAIQEWEAVLAVAPERLDARAGLLETYWREGLYDRVEQLAGQVLKDVPGCEKALLLLAYVTSLKSMLQAQELIRRAQVFDPDLLMAQDLFSDLLASQPAEPFLDLLKKPPVLLKSPTAPVVSPVPVVDAPKRESAPTWESMEQWSERKNSSESSAPPTLTTWPESQVAESSAWSNFISTIPSESIQSPAPTAPTEYPTAHASESQWEGMQRSSPDQQDKTEIKQPEAQSEPWEMLQNALSKANAEGGNLSDLSPEIWATLDQYLQKGGVNEEAHSPEERQKQDLAPAPVVAQENVERSAPPWMSSLNQTERRQTNETGQEAADRQNPHSNGNRATSPSTWSAPQAAAQNIRATTPIPQKEASKSQSSWPPEPENVASIGNDQPAASEEEEEDSFFGPAWLRSLGAAGFEEEQAVDKDKTIVPEVAAAQMQALPQYDVWSASKQQKEEAPWVDTSNQSGEEPGVEEEESGNLQQEPTWMSSLQPTAEQSVASRQEPSWMDSLRQSSEPSWLSSLQQASGPSWMDALQQEATSPVEEKGSTESKELYAWNSALNVTPESDWRSSYTPDYSTDGSWGQVEQAQKNSFEPQDDPLMTTLKELEQGLLAQGFVPLEPNTLSSLAQAEERLQAERVEPLQSTMEPSLSSALAELGGFATQAKEQAKEYEPQVEQQKEPTAPFRTPTMPAAMPLPQVVREEQAAARQAESVTQKAPTQPFQPQIPPVEASGIPPYILSPGAQPAAYNATPVTRPASNGQRVPDLAVREDNVNGLNFRPSPPAESTNAPVVYIDPLLDSELETTMKRPAIRIQPARGGGAKESSAASTRVRTGERSAGSRVSEPGTGNQERLIIGYQHQLVGDYDEAMQEYRLIIRGAPELLGDVISNVRALLKLAPKYAAGYRVLGDAYMRQGEYLQAMEAYNKALTMAKKK
jgi:tetratricopeptide (TPR) repeat protein